MRKLFLAIAVAAVANFTIPASAASPAECTQLLNELRVAKKRIVTGGIAPNQGYEDARKAEEAARDEMVSTGCNKKVNAYSPMCRGIIARVNAATANRQAMENEYRKAGQIAAAVKEAELTARYELECRQAQTPKTPAAPRKQVERKRAYDPDAVDIAVGTALIFGLSGAMMPRARGPAGPGPGPGSMQHPRR